jgi:hypothetical protein
MVLGEEKYAADLEGETHILYSTEGGPWVFGLPQSFVESLANLSEAEYPRIVEKWVATGEMAHMGASAADVLPPFRELAKVAQSAKDQNKSLMLFMSL